MRNFKATSCRASAGQEWNQSTVSQKEEFNEIKGKLREI